MKTRIIQTKFWKDATVQGLSLYAQHLFIYLLSSEHIGLTGIFELPDAYLLLESKLTEHQLSEAKNELSEKGRVKFFNGWIRVVNAEKYNNYTASPKNQTAYTREFESIPIEVLKGFDTTIDTTIDSNHKPETINKKPETKKEYLTSKEAKEHFYSKFNHLTRKDIDIELEKMVGWLEANGKTKKNYKAFANTWLLNVKGKIPVKDPTHIPYKPRTSDFTDIGAELLNRYQTNE